jgi:hypothetical protein
MANAPRLDYIRTDVEVQRSTYKLAGGPVQNWEQLTVMPSFGIKWNNYIYNPDLLAYFLLFEPGYFWQQNQVSGSQSRTREQTLNGTGTVNLLSAKPYSTSVSFGRSRQDVQSDFFSSQTVNAQNWGVQSGYRDGPVPVTFTFDQSHEDRTGDNQDFITDQSRLGLHAFNDRKNGDMTVLDYQYNRYHNESITGSSSYLSESSSNHTLLTDMESFHNSALSSSLFFNQFESRDSSSSDLNASSNYSRELTPHLRGYCTYLLNDSFGNGYNSVQNSVVTGINHQLYESLGSHLDLHGTSSDSNSEGAVLKSSSYGIAASANYNKRLGVWGHLSMNSSASFDMTDQNSSGGELIIPDESYTLPAAGPLIIRLKNPTDLSITSITKNNAPLDASEWRAITTFDPWQIQFFSGGAHSIANGDIVVITYVVQPNPSGNYSTTNYTGDIALRFWHDQAGIRASYMTTENSTNSQDFILQNIQQYQFGADVGWHGLHGDASYTRQHSTLYSYQNYSLSEGYSLPISPQSNVGVTFSQQWNSYPAGSGSSANKSQTLEFYSYMVHYDWHPARAFSLSAEAGLQQQRGSLEDQDLFAARVYLNWMFPKLEVHLGYEDENLQYVSDVYTRHYLFLRMRRSF